MLLVVPLPFSLRRRIFTYVDPLPWPVQASPDECFLHILQPLQEVARPQWRLTIPVTTCSFISENPLIAKLQYGLKITFIFILILFIDSVNRVYRVQVELASATDGAKGAA